MKRGILIDLGNVLFTFDHHKAAKQVAQVLGTSQDLVKQLFWQLGLVADYENGVLSSDAFLAACLDLADDDLEVDTDQLWQAWCDIFQPNQPMLALLPQWAAQGFPMVLVSNTNEAHFKFLQHGVGDNFGGSFAGFALSYELACGKPDQQFYELALAKIGLAATECFYIDDIAAYTQAGSRLGLTTHTYAASNHDALLAAFAAWQQQGPGSGAVVK